MSFRKCIILLLICCGCPVFGQMYFYPNPGDQGHLTGCLFNNGHRVYLSGVPVHWYGYSTSGSGGHNHGNTGRPNVCLTLVNACGVYQDTVDTTTGTDGCSTVQTKAPWYAGEYFVEANVPAPYTSSVIAGYEVAQYGVGPISVSGTNYTISSDPAHNAGVNGANTVGYNDLLSVAQYFQYQTKSPLAVSRMGLLPGGGFLDSFTFWSTTPSITEMHENGQAFDAVLLFGTSSQLTTAMSAGHCPATYQYVVGYGPFYHGACY